MPHRQIRDRKTPLGFGKYKDKTMESIAYWEPEYLSWLWHGNILKVENEEDYKWWGEVVKEYDHRRGATKVEEIPEFVPPKDIRTYTNRHDVLGFGKYSDITFKDVSEIDPKYFRALYQSKLILLLKDLTWFAMTARKASGYEDESESRTI